MSSYVGADLGRMVVIEAEERVSEIKQHLQSERNKPLSSNKESSGN
jgi:hypothetical protein